MGEAGPVARALGAVPACRPHRDADAVPRGNRGLQRAADRLGADVPGAATTARSDAAHPLPGTTSLGCEAQLSRGPRAALHRVVWSLSQAHRVFFRTVI